MKRYRVGFSRAADAQVETIESWWRENRPAAPDMFSRELEWRCDFSKPRL